MRWTYNEIQTYIREDIIEFINDGLDINQATSRVQVEYQDIIEENNIEKLFIYIALAKLGLEHGFLREDVQKELLEIKETCPDLKNELDDDEYKQLQKDIKRIFKEMN